MSEIKIMTTSAEETEALGRKIAGELHEGYVVALYGGMGAGKTALVRGIAAGLGVEDNVSSPTFALVNQYRGKFDIYHFDMYRVSGWDDLYSTGFFDYLDGNGILIIEWSENIEFALPDDAIHIEISRGERENERVFQIKGMKFHENICG